MDIAVLGTGQVGAAIAGRLVEVGHRVMMGARSAGNEKAVAWAAEAGPSASQGAFADAAAFGELVVNCTAGASSLAALRQAGAQNLEGKVLIDVANPLDFSHGMPPSLTVCNTDSLGEQIQREFPGARVVKSLNTMNNGTMIHPETLPGDHLVFMSGDDVEAKATVAGILRSFGWRREVIVDLGGISTARATEMYVAFWVALVTALGVRFNIVAAC